MTEQTVLRVENVDKIYKNGVKALSGVSFNVDNGEFVSVIGPSGSGKSTLLRCINRMIDASEGDIYFIGQSVNKADKRQIKEIRKNIGMIFQHYNLVYRLNALENVLHGKLGSYSAMQSALGLYTAKDVKKAIEILHMLGLEERIYEQCSNLSGGQKQRVGIARALIQEPKMILCDEPIASLDPQASKVIMEYLYDITRTFGIPCLVNLHQVEVAKSYSDRIIGLRNGEIVFSGKPGELTADMISHIYGVSSEELIS